MPKDSREFMLDEYVFRRKVLKLFGAAFHVYDKAGNVVMYSKQKAFKLKEDIRIFDNEQMSRELISILTPNIIDLWARYNIKDSLNGEAAGEIKRKAIASMFRDEWEICAVGGNKIAVMIEKNYAMAFLARIIPLMPQVYVILDNNGVVQAEIERHFNPIVLKYTMKIIPNPAIDRRLMIACGILLCAIEGRQE